MAYLGIKLGRHSFQASLWNTHARRAEEAHMSRLEVESASWLPVLALDIMGGHTEWSDHVWDRLPAVSLAPLSLLEYLAGRAPRAEATRYDLAGVLARTLWAELAEIGAQDLRPAGTHMVGVASTVSLGPDVQELLAATAPPGLDLSADRVWDVSVCALVARRQEPGALSPGPVVHVHLGGRMAQIHLWEVESAGDALLLHRVGQREAPGASVGAILEAVCDRVTGEWDYLEVYRDEDPGPESVYMTKLRPHLLYFLGRSRAQWCRNWRYEFPGKDAAETENYEYLAHWRPSGQVQFPADQVQGILARAGDALMAALDPLLQAGGLARDQVRQVVATGAGATDLYLLPYLQKLFGVERCPTSPRAELLPAMGAAALAYAAADAGSGLRVEVREGMMIGAELADEGFDALVPEQGDGWDEGVRIYDVPPGVSEVRLRAGVRRVSASMPILATLALPEDLRGPAALVLRVWREGDGWWAQTSRRDGAARSQPTRLRFPGPPG